MAALTSERNTREVFCNALNLHRVKEIAEGSVIHVGKNGGTNKIPCGILRDILSSTEVIVEVGNHFFAPTSTSTSASTGA